MQRIYIPKTNGKLRPLGIPTMKDRAMQAIHLLALDPVAATTAHEDSYRFRQKRDARMRSIGCGIALRRRGSSQWVLEGDSRLARVEDVPSSVEVEDDLVLMRCRDQAGSQHVRFDSTQHDR